MLTHFPSSVPVGTNLYGNHPVYFEHRTTGTHGVFLLSSNGMDVMINQENGGTTLEYNVIGGVFDFYFFGGACLSPTLSSKHGMQFTQHEMPLLQVPRPLRSHSSTHKSSEPPLRSRTGRSDSTSADMATRII